MPNALLYPFNNNITRKCVHVENTVENKDKREIMNALLLKLFNECRILFRLTKSKDISGEMKYLLVQSYVRMISASFDATSDYIAIGHLAIDDIQ